MCIRDSDHLDLWNSDRDLGDLEMLVAELARITRFNRNVDPLREVCRSIALFGEKPEQVTEERWRQASAKAFGDFQSEIETVFLPLMLLATRWVVGEDAAEEPLVDPGLLYGQTCLSAEERDCARTRLGEMTWSRDEAIKALAPSVRSNGLPTPPVIFFRRPFVALSGARVIATSPRMVREHMMLACWDRLRRSFGGDRWTIAFGVAVEGWCRRVAAMAAASTAFHGTLELSERIGDETEIEDVVVCDGDRVALFSVKSRLMREGLVKTAELGRAAVVRWYEQVLFDAETDTQRQGALRQLDEKVAAIRAGKHEPRIQRDAHVFPVLVTFEDLGDNVALGAWMHERCTQLGVLRGDRIAPPTLATVAHFETIMALAADGTSIFSLIGQSDVKSGRYRQLQSVLHEVRPGAPKRLPQIQSMFDAITNAMVRRLFGRDATDAELAAPDSGSM